jgi:hypothetical protein
MLRQETKHLAVLLARYLIAKFPFRKSEEVAREPGITSFENCIPETEVASLSQTSFTLALNW